MIRVRSLLGAALALVLAASFPAPVTRAETDASAGAQTTIGAHHFTFLGRTRDEAAGGWRWSYTVTAPASAALVGTWVVDLGAEGVTVLSASHSHELTVNDVTGSQGIQFDIDVASGASQEFSFVIAEEMVVGPAQISVKPPIGAIGIDAETGLQAGLLVGPVAMQSQPDVQPDSNTDQTPSAGQGDTPAPGVIPTGMPQTGAGGTANGTAPWMAVTALAALGVSAFIAAGRRAKRVGSPA